MPRSVNVEMTDSEKLAVAIEALKNIAHTTSGMDCNDKAEDALREIGEWSL